MTTRSPDSANVSQTAAVWVAHQAFFTYRMPVQKYRIAEMIHETTYTKARERLASLMDQVTDTREPVLILRRGREPVALIAADELASWLETAYLLRSPKNARRLLEASERARQREGETMDVEELRARLGLTEQ